MYKEVEGYAVNLVTVLMRLGETMEVKGITSKTQTAVCYTGDSCLLLATQENE